MGPIQEGWMTGNSALRVEGSEIDLLNDGISNDIIPTEKTRNFSARSSQIRESPRVKSL